MDGARSGDYDIVGSLFHDPDVESFMLYGEPFYQTQVRFVQKAGGTYRYTGLASLEPFTIAVGDGFLYEETFDRAGHLNKQIVTTALQGVQMVAYGRADLTLDSVDVIAHAINHDSPEIAGMVEFVPGVLTEHAIHMAVGRTVPNHQQIVDDFNRVLTEMRADGSLHELLSQHVSQ